MRKLVAILFLGALACGGANAQSLAPFDRDLLSLAGHFGTMHHLTQICEHQNEQMWRDNMLELLRLEDPSRDQRNRMSARFNDAYNEVEQRFPSCTPEARAYAARLASEGAELASRMALTLR